MFPRSQPKCQVAQARLGEEPSRSTRVKKNTRKRASSSFETRAAHAPQDEEAFNRCRCVRSSRGRRCRCRPADPRHAAYRAHAGRRRRSRSSGGAVPGLNASRIEPASRRTQPECTSTEMSLIPGGTRNGVVGLVLQRHLHEVAEDRRGEWRGLRVARRASAACRSR